MLKDLNILLAIPDRLENPMGGMGESARKLIQALERGKYPVHIDLISTGEERDYTYNSVCDVYSANVFGQRHYPFDVGGFVQSVMLSTPILAASAKVIKNKTPDILHFEDFPTFFAGISLKNSLGIPFIAHVQLSVTHAYSVPEEMSPIEHSQQEICSWLQSEGIIQADNVVVVSKYYGNLVIPVVKRNVTSVLVNGVDPFVSDVTREEFPLPGREGKRIGYIGRFAEMKNLPETVKALPEEYDLIMCGPNEGSDLSILEDLKSIAASKDNVFVLPAKYGRDKEHFLKYCDFGIFPSKHEPFGITGLEWMSAGTPLIASGQGGMTEYLWKGNHIRCGVDAKSINSALKSLNQYDLSLLKKNGIETAKSFSWDRAAQDYFNLWLNLHIERRAGRC